MSTILVTGGTGTLGRLVVPRLQQASARVRVLSRTEHPSVDGVSYVPGDLASGAGIEAAVRGVDTVVHLAGNAKGDGDLARRLVAAAAAAGRPHLVSISVVGAERVPVVSGVDRAMFGYFAAKREAELVVAGSGLPWTTLRATQFHDLTLTTVRTLGKLPTDPGVGRVPVPARRRRRGRRPAGRARARRPGRPGAGHRRADGVRHGRAGPKLPAGHGAAPTDRAAAAAGPGGRGDPERCQPGSGPGGRRTDLGGLPRAERLKPTGYRPADRYP